MDETARRTERTAAALRLAIGQPTVWARRTAPAPVSPWVQRAIAHRLPVKDFTGEIVR